MPNRSFQDDLPRTRPDHSATHPSQFPYLRCTGNPNVHEKRQILSAQRGDRTRLFNKFSRKEGHVVVYKLGQRLDSCPGVSSRVGSRKQGRQEGVVGRGGGGRGRQMRRIISVAELLAGEWLSGGHETAWNTSQRNFFHTLG